MIPTTISFKALLNDDFVAAAVFGAVSNERLNKLTKGEIPKEPTHEEKQRMKSNEIDEWKKTTDIVFMDYACNKKLMMSHISDALGPYEVVSLG